MQLGQLDWTTNNQESMPNAHFNNFEKYALKMVSMYKYICQITREATGAIIKVSCNVVVRRTIIVHRSEDFIFRVKAING